MSVVTINKLTKSYPSFKLDEVSFTLEAGRIAGFIGRNGAGKTTTIKSMLNLVHPDSGEMNYFGLPLTGNEAAIKQRIGYSTGKAAACLPKDEFIARFSKEGESLEDTFLRLERGEADE